VRPNAVGPAGLSQAHNLAARIKLREKFMQNKYLVEKVKTDETCIYMQRLDQSSLAARMKKMRTYVLVINRHSVFFIFLKQPTPLSSVHLGW
jgi:hypothetical protein